MPDHYVDVVDKNDNAVGKELKSRKQELGFISRVVAILVKDSQNRFIICRRSPAKADIPDKWDISAAGAVDFGETYEDAAKRELKEELNISCKLVMLEKFYQEFGNGDRKYRLWVGVFIGTSDSIPKLNRELAEYKMMSFDEIAGGMAKNTELYVPGFINDFNQVKEKLGTIVKKKNIE